MNNINQSLHIDTEPVIIVTREPLAAIDRCLTALADKLAKEPARNRGVAADLIEQIERLTAVRTALISGECAIVKRT